VQQRRRATVGASVYGTKGGSFCAADDTIDRDTVNADSEAGFVKALKAHRHQIDTMKANLPSGSVGQDAKKLVNIAESVIVGGKPNQFFAAAGNSSVAITYCGVQGNGRPRPETVFSKTFVPIFEAASNATSDAATLSAATAYQTQLNQLASELSTLPKAIKAQATDAVQTAQSAISSKSAAPLTSEANNSAADVALYCGQNE
jgi:hypothetical protein